MRDAPLRNRVFERGLDVFLADQLGERLRPVLAGDDLVHGRREKVQYARPRVIRGTRVKPLPLLPSGPGGVRSRPLHEARSLTTPYATSFASEDNQLLNGADPEKDTTTRPCPKDVGRTDYDKELRVAHHSAIGNQFGIVLRQVNWGGLTSPAFSAVTRQDDFT